MILNAPPVANRRPEVWEMDYPWVLLTDGRWARVVAHSPAYLTVRIEGAFDEARIPHSLVSKGL